ncbi:UbiD family decarboxylase [Hydrogenoanaerobacterium sp.]|uniref:UbiD family decarboxylase n=1 Tax=Hydrogenoanaerobacterium sp. TaxID=2953763 RepID=UPI00289A38F1|nr:UbiD family decarboxylase [Hydrogenoanaerobacterium sp.]
MAMDLKACLNKLEQAGRLAHVITEVDLKHEMAGICAKLEGKQVLQFDRLKGQKYPVVSGMWWNRDNLAAIFDTTAEKLPFLFSDAVKSMSSAPVAPVVVEDAPAQQERMKQPDLTQLPIPTLALLDGGPYFSNCIIIAKDPDTGVRNTSIHRLMVTGKDRLGILMDTGRHLRNYYERAQERGEALEITINNGVHPAYYVAATTPSSAAPLEVDELAVASHLLGEPARLCCSHTVAPEGIADAQLIMEGEVLPHIREPEGPFGEVSGYYASQDDRWVVKIKEITMQKDPVIHMLHPGKEVWNSVGLTAEAGIFQSVGKQVSGLKKVYLSHGGSHYHAILQMDPPQNGMAKNAILAAFAAFPALQMVTVVNSDVNLYDTEDVERAMVTRCDPAKDIIIIPNAFGHELNPVVKDGMAAKMGFDCTCPLPRAEKYTRVEFQNVDLSNYQIQ